MYDDQMWLIYFLSLSHISSVYIYKHAIRIHTVFTLAFMVSELPLYRVFIQTLFKPN